MKTISWLRKQLTGSNIKFGSSPQIIGSITFQDHKSNEKIIAKLKYNIPSLFFF